MEEGPHFTCVGNNYATTVYHRLIHLPQKLGLSQYLITNNRYRIISITPRHTIHQGRSKSTTAPLTEEPKNRHPRAEHEQNNHLGPPLAAIEAPGHAAASAKTHLSAGAQPVATTHEGHVTTPLPATVKTQVRKNHLK